MEESIEQFVGPGMSPYPDTGVAAKDGQKVELALDVKVKSGKLSDVHVTADGDQSIKIELTWARAADDHGVAPSTAARQHSSTLGPHGSTSSTVPRSASPSTGQAER